MTIEARAQRPGETDYVVHAGGNTRLRILKELFSETGDPQFGKVACGFRPWTREADVLLAHLKENDLRGELTFLDKAPAMADAKALLEEEVTGELNQTRLAEILKDRGYSLRRLPETYIPECVGFSFVLKAHQQAHSRAM